MRSSLPFRVWVRTLSLFLCLTQNVLAMVLNNSSQFESILEKYKDKGEEWWQARPRGRRAISEGDMHLILDLHNKLRGQVHPPASNMEYMVSAGVTAVKRIPTLHTFLLIPQKVIINYLIIIDHL